MTVMAAAQQKAADMDVEDRVDDPVNWLVPPEHRAAVDAWAAAGGAEEAVTAAVSGKSGLPLADRDTAWDSSAAKKRLADAGKLADGCFWRDPDGDPDTQAAYKLPFADIKGGRLTAIPAGVIAAAGAVQGSRGGVDIPDTDVAGVKARISGYYRTMDMTPPWEQDSETAASEVDVAVAPPQAGNGMALQVDDLVQVDTDTGPLVGRITELERADDGSGTVESVTVQLDDGTELEVPPGQVSPVDEDDGQATGTRAPLPVARTAAGAPLAPPDVWFNDPRLDRPTALTVTADGRVYGHLATWGTCHTGMTQGGMCVTAPHSATDYRMFHLGEVETASGAALPVGRLTLGTGHAGTRLGFRAAASHYDNTGTQVAVVRAGEDEHGIWLAGSVTPEASPEQVAALRRSPLSGDWRRVAGNLELVAALAVNSPGFPIPRPRAAADAMSRQASLVAAGVIEPDMTRDDLVEVLTSAAATAVECVMARRDRVQALDVRMRGGQSSRRRGDADV